MRHGARRKIGDLRGADKTRADRFATLTEALNGKPLAVGSDFDLPSQRSGSRFAAWAIQFAIFELAFRVAMARIQESFESLPRDKVRALIIDDRQALPNPVSNRPRRHTADLCRLYHCVTAIGADAPCAHPLSHRRPFALQRARGCLRRAKQWFAVQAFGVEESAPL